MPAAHKTEQNRKSETATQLEEWNAMDGTQCKLSATEWNHNETEDMQWKL